MIRKSVYQIITSYSDSQFHTGIQKATNKLNRIAQAAQIGIGKKNVHLNTLMSILSYINIASTNLSYLIDEVKEQRDAINNDLGKATIGLERREIRDQNKNKLMATQINLQDLIGEIKLLRQTSRDIQELICQILEL